MDQLALQLLQPQLGALLVRQVADEAGEDPAVGAVSLPDRQLHRELGAVLALPDDDAADADDPSLAGLEIMTDVAIVPRPVVAGHQQADVAAEDLCFPVAEQALGRGAERLD